MKLHVNHKPEITRKLYLWDLQRISNQMVYGFESKLYLGEIFSVVLPKSRKLQLKAQNRLKLEWSLVKDMD